MIQTRMRHLTCLEVMMEDPMKVTAMKISVMIQTSVRRTIVMNLTVMKVLVKTGLTWRLKLLMTTGIGLMMTKVEEEEEVAATLPREENRNEGRNKGLKNLPKRATRVIETELQRKARNTRAEIVIVTGSVTEVDLPKSPQEP